MWTRRTTLNIIRNIDKNLTKAAFDTELDSLIGVGNNNIDFKIFKTLCDSRRKKAEQQKETWMIKSLIKRKKKENGEDYPDEYPLPKYPKPEEEESDEYPYPRRKKRKYPHVLDGVIDLEEFLDFLAEFAVFKKMVFNREKIIKLLKTNIWRAMTVSQGKLNPLVMSRATEILMSQ